MGIQDSKVQDPTIVGAAEVVVEMAVASTGIHFPNSEKIFVSISFIHLLETHLLFCGLETHFNICGIFFSGRVVTI